MQSTDHRTEPVDASFERRPGVPAQREPRTVGHAHWLVPEKQISETRVVKDATRDSLTATFGTGQPPRGLSGVLRRAAYRIPDYEAKRWAILLFADRVDSLEGRIASAATNPFTWIAAGAAALTVWASSPTKRRSRRWFARWQR